MCDSVFANAKDVFMKRVLLMVPALLVGTAQAQVDLESEEARLGYALGMQVGESIKRLGTEVDLDALTQAIRDTMTDQEPQLSMEEAGQVLMALRQQVQQQQQAAQAEQQAVMAEAAGENMAASQAFLEENQAKEGVQTTESGLQYRVMEQGEGATPGADDVVTVHYRGTLVDGTEFDSSYGRGQPATFPVGGVIPGWTEALQMMPVGSKYELYIPPELAYGESGAGGRIGPNEALIFEVELLDIQGEGG